jgi:AraC-like DNA-binding protein
MGPFGTDPGLLTRHVIAAFDGVRVLQISCRKPAGSWASPDDVAVGECGLVLVRRGGFIRRVGRRTAFVDATTAYFEPPFADFQIGHEADGGDRSTLIAMSEHELTAAVGPVAKTNALIPTSAAIDVAHRALTLRLLSGIDEFELHERLSTLLAMLLRDSQPSRRFNQHQRAEAAHRRIVDHARQAIASDPGAASLGRLASELGHSRYHVSRVFSRTSGMTLSRYRNRIRATLALDRLADGETNLAGLAADLGFVDQSHLIRVMRAAFGRPPTDLRRLLSDPGVPRRSAVDR